MSLRGGNTGTGDLFAGEWEFYTITNTGRNMEDQQLQEAAAAAWEATSEETLSSGDRLPIAAHETVEVNSKAASIHLERVCLAANVSERATCIVIEALCDGSPVTCRVYPDDNGTSDFDMRRNGI